MKARLMERKWQSWEEVMPGVGVFASSSYFSVFLCGSLNLTLSNPCLSLRDFLLLSHRFTLFHISGDSLCQRELRLLIQMCLVLQGASA